MCKYVESAKGKPEEKGKFKICILSPLNIKEWREDSIDIKVFPKFVEESTYNEGKLYFISEESLKGLEKGTTKEAKIGDYAIFNDSLLLSFNPTTSDLKEGDFYFSPGNIEAYTNIFRLLKERSEAFKEDFEEAIVKCKQDYQGKIPETVYNNIFS